MKYTSKYIAPTLTIDLALYEIIDGQLNVLLLNRPNDPFKGHWALPGGYVAKGQTTLDALHQKMLDKIDIDTCDIPFIDQLRTFDAVGRDPRGHAVSISYVAAGHAIQSPKTAHETAFFPVDNLPEIAYDHAEVIAFGRQRLVNEIRHTSLIKVFLPPLFTMSELQKAYEAILGQKLDKRNFQKKFFKLDQLIKTDKMKYHANSRPATLYKFSNDLVEKLSDNFD
jgi:8-oxo-dGTP diphosphatase